jgi:signal transduction histidine kinase
VVRDISDRGLLQLQDEFLAMASHELRTPLTALFGYLQLHRRHLESGQSGESVHRSITRALEQVEHLRVLVDDLLDVERLRTGRLSLRRVPTDLTPLVARVVAFAESLTHGKTLRVTLPSEPLTVDGDAVRLEQVLLNLITNAVEHAPDSSAVDVTLRADGGEAELAVRDYGPGIPAAEVGQIFTRYRQAAQGRRTGSRGLGLGLYITHEIVEEHGGTIGVESTEGQGARFAVRLPLLPTPP